MRIATGYAQKVALDGITDILVRDGRTDGKASFCSILS